MEWTLQVPEIRQQIKETNLKKYGVTNPFYLEQFRKNNDKAWNKILSWEKFVKPNFSRQQFSGYTNQKQYQWICSKCGNIFKQKMYHTGFFKGDSRLPRCLKCFPMHSGYSNMQKDVVFFIKQLCDFTIIQNDHKLIHPKQLDIVIPEKKIAIQFNGVYWHSDERKNDKNYHLNKTLSCEKAGYKLIHIWENDWVNKNELIKNKIKALLGIDQTKIYARKCQIKQIDPKIKNDFLNKHHIQCEDKSKIRLGLFYQNELVAVMTFGKPRFNKKYEYELIRYATSKHVIGGAGKLLKYFELNYSPKSIITYADSCYSKGNMYRKIGFNELKPSNPGYVWTNGNNTLSRYQCQKHKLSKLLGDNFNEQLSETQNMLLNGFSKLYDCGNLIFQKIQ